MSASDPLSHLDVARVPGLGVLAVALAILLLVALWGWWRAATRLGRRSRARQRLARRAETDAERLLEELGFTVLERQASRGWRLDVDATRLEVTSRVDLLVEREGRLYVADVKSGDEAPDPRLPATRRQLLEYLLAFDADGALLVDMRRREARVVAFPGLLE